jgi:hypothetical protein
VSEPVQGAVPDSVMDFSHYEWLFTVSKAERVPGLVAGQAHYQDVIGKYREARAQYTEAEERYQGESTMRDVRLDACANLIMDLARLLNVPPEKLGREVQLLKAQLELALTQLEDGPRRANLERIQELEERNGKLELALTKSGELLQQHTKRWATASNMLNKLEALATPSLYIAGKACLEGLRTPDAQLVLHLI